jgi:hypothetical protein
MGLFDELVPPWPDWEDVQVVPEQEIADRLQEQVDAAIQHEPSRPAALGLIVAVGNYEWASGRKSTIVIDKAETLLQQHQPTQGRYWG